MPLSARNQLAGTVESVKNLGLKKGSKVKAIIKSTDVMIANDQ